MGGGRLCTIIKEFLGFKNEAPSQLCFVYFDKVVSSILVCLRGGDIAMDGVHYDLLLGVADKPGHVQTSLMKCKLWDWMAEQVPGLPVAAKDEINILLLIFLIPLHFWNFSVGREALIKSLQIMHL